MIRLCQMLDKPVPLSNSMDLFVMFVTVYICERLTSEVGCLTSRFLFTVQYYEIVKILGLNILNRLFFLTGDICQRHTPYLFPIRLHFLKLGETCTYPPYDSHVALQLVILVSQQVCYPIQTFLHGLCRYFKVATFFFLTWNKRSFTQILKCGKYLLEPVSTKTFLALFYNCECLPVFRDNHNKIVIKMVSFIQAHPAVYKIINKC